MPAARITAGTTQSAGPVSRSVNWYGGAIAAHGNSSRITTMPRFDGFMKCRSRPRTGARSTHLPPTATMTPKIITQTWSLT